MASVREGSNQDAQYVYRPGRVCPDCCRRVGEGFWGGSFLRCCRGRLRGADGVRYNVKSYVMEEQAIACQAVHIWGGGGGEEELFA